MIMMTMIGRAWLINENLLTWSATWMDRESLHSLTFDLNLHGVHVIVTRVTFGVENGLGT